MVVPRCLAAPSSSSSVWTPGPGKVLVVVVGLERFRLEQPPGEPHAGQQHAPVQFQRQVVGLDDGRLERIGRPEADVAAALGPLLPGCDGHAGLALELALHAFAVACRREGELEIGVRHLRVGAPEAVDVRRAQRQHALAREQVLGDLAHQPQAAHALVDGVDVLDAGDEARGVVVAQVLADAGKRVLHGDAERAEQCGRPYAGQLQQLRRVVRSRPPGSPRAAPAPRSACRRVRPSDSARRPHACLPARGWWCGHA